MAYADVIVPRHLHRFFTYAIPPHLESSVRIGTRVIVPFGSTTLHGLVVSVSTQLPNEDRRQGIREIASVIPEESEGTLPQELLDLSRQISDYYLAPWGQCLRLILPPRQSHPRPCKYTLTAIGQTVASEGKETRRVSAAMRSVLVRLAKAPKGLTVSSLRRAAGRSVGSVIATLKRRGWIQEIQRAVEEGGRRPGRRTGSRANTIGSQAPLAIPSSSFGSLPAQAQQTGESCEPTALSPPAGWERLLTSIRAQHHEVFLLQAPVAERLTLLMQAAEAALAQERSVLIIAPEFLRASVIAAQARQRWGARTALLHSGLPDSARADIWRRSAGGSINLVVGTRSALFAPLKRLGLICVEEEDDPLYKEETEPRYHAREVAQMRAHKSDAVLLLSSMHPSLETLQALGALQCDTLRSDAACDNILLGAQQTPSPLVQVVDLRQHPYGTVLSEPLIAGIEAALDAHAGVILFLNRKGFAPALLCRDCGQAPSCPRCSVALTFYKHESRLACPYCGVSLPIPDTCPSCLAARLEPVGSGTERIDEVVRRLFPKAKIARLDRALARTSSKAQAIRKLAAAGEIDLLIGTQMLFNGPPLPRVGYVGIVQADAGLHRPDFRASERTYHLLLDAIALARPADAGGQVLLQTYMPDHHVIRAISEHNPALFYEREVAFRKALSYPPFTHLILLRVSGTDPDRVQNAAKEWGDALRGAASRVAGKAQADMDLEEILILGPVPSPLEQLRGRRRWQLLVKSRSAERAREIVKDTLSTVERAGRKGRLKFEVDVEPVEMR